jgi:hypothetical protein
MQRRTKRGAALVAGLSYAARARAGSQAVEMIESTPQPNLGLAGARGLQAAAVRNPVFGFGDF